MNEKVLEVVEENSQIPSSRIHSRQPSKSNVLLLTASKLTNKNTEQKSPFEDVINASVNSKSQENVGILNE